MMKPNETDCLQIRLNKKSLLEVSTSFTPLQILEKPVSIQIQLVSGNSSQEIELPDTTCLQGDCYLNLTFSKIDSYLNFQLTVQYLDGVINLYDGIAQRFHSERPYSSAQYFKYHFGYTTSIEIFLTSRLHSKYTLMAKLVPRA